MDPPVLAALRESELPFGKHFPFNNGALFTKPSTEDRHSLSPMLWDMGQSSMRQLIGHLDALKRRSLTLTNDVLLERHRLETCVKEIQPLLDVGLIKINALKHEIKQFEDNKSTIEDNKNFTYTTVIIRQELQPLPKGQHVTNCLHCNNTCHENCRIPNDEDKKGCWAMDGNGFCRICEDKCFWDKHKNTPYIIKYISVEETKTYAEMKAKYEEASKKHMTYSEILERKNNELNQIADVIEEMMINVRNCNMRLCEIALRPNPLTMTQHIDMMIENEKLLKKSGWLQRIEALNRIRERAQVIDKAESFTRDNRQIKERFRELFGYDK
ncbi:uncharacterized protein LOC127844671 [Dreissena polymorpha]|nr:uncharacterized protein LOC127844671 [Dreissena polymorpha]